MVDGVVGDCVGVIVVSPVHIDYVTVQAGWERIDGSDAEEEAEAVGCVAFKANELAELKNEHFVDGVDSCGYAGQDVPWEVVATVELGLVLFVGFDWIVCVFASWACEEAFALRHG